MSTDETYNGWTNRETWALNLWLSNDQGLYEMTRERVAQALSSDPTGIGQSMERPGEVVAGETIAALWGELSDPDDVWIGHAEIQQMVREVGSAWRVNWDEIGAAWLENLDDDPETDSSGDES